MIFTVHHTISSILIVYYSVNHLLLPYHLLLVHCPYAPHKVINFYYIVVFYHCYKLPSQFRVVVFIFGIPEGGEPRPVSQYIRPTCAMHIPR